ncbi:MAG: hypothetical protein A3C85_00310 [Candidatus Doudnabacteria bacterium RIFCSPHIGHO2_02_FULL_48_21]|uniref:Ribulose-phosphate 3-epimerase n=1 Tax=Candidatus Doudnabacteria bacterium RIFCSPLOWO2_02_FULL_48_13 TaxID=1817845 RepID=A0A1F5QCC6_9BACT|nr:MAG: hypothetical protein A3K05_01405 [Candidatus Doudnabacteria bacterium RIFCSPHIGHO2_01_48_18]OGE77539.1 MAG: hypothetical protein A2668_03600 [Candidatus Doudnabacteria bacterium RIFCSPHIGHO2_01_FULL_48_180]OGE91680.1 MAG: hypothetical protein A3F44_03160 [Candidatus Doudnabacteria bacterium RIFCSPHIGHO2_12_FULL_47_25]OGE93374.1 MAG: hypothetical protein A3C85_00310 [Candidatus Doudnabacteria bacterium RIFCSPHIGHO2_02_FULL_48_21]OGE97458.1 MAG: hypothetical protein A3A83_01245 [Candidatu
MATLLPAILSKDTDEVHEKIKFLESIPEITEVHIDFEDGKFVPNTTVLPKDLFGLKTRLKIDAHMMVTEPQAYFHDLEHLGADTVDVHFESFNGFRELLNAASNLRTMKMRAAVVINPETDIAVFQAVAPQIDIMFVMSVYPGFQGKPFLPQSLDRIHSLRKSYPGGIIQIDGGISRANIEAVRGHGADRIVVGSGIWQNMDVKKTIYELLELIK